MKNLIFVFIIVSMFASCAKHVTKKEFKIDEVSLKAVAEKLMNDESFRRRRTTPITIINQSATLTLSPVVHTSWTFGNISAHPADYIMWTQCYFLTPDQQSETLFITSGFNYVYQDGYYDQNGAYLIEKDFPLTMPTGTYTMMLGHITLNGMLVYTNTVEVIF